MPRAGACPTDPIAGPPVCGLSLILGRFRRLRLVLGGSVRGLGCTGRLVAVADIELQAEAHGRIGEGDHRAIGDAKVLRHIAEGQGHAEILVTDLQIPELVLQHDGHFAGIAFAQVLRNLGLGVVGAEGDIEMVVAGQAVLRDEFERPPDDATQSVLDHAIVSQVAFRHGHPCLYSCAFRLLYSWPH